MIRIFFAWVILCFGATTVSGQDMALRLVSPEALWPQDSIPDSAGERIVIEFEYVRADGDTGYIPATWVVALINRPYEQTHILLHDVIHEAVGVESERELRPTVNAKTSADPHQPKEPLFGDGFAGFHAIGVPIIGIREYRIKTKPYNTHVRWWKSSSMSEWRLIDGAPLFDKACTILVVSRTDHSRQWAWMHPGIPLPFTTIYETKLVTDKEVAMIATLHKQLGQPVVQYFVPLTGYHDNGVLKMMTAILDAAKDLPEE